MMQSNSQREWYMKNRTRILAKSKARGYSRPKQVRAEQLERGLCGFSKCQDTVVLGNTLCEKHAKENGVRNRKYHFNYTDADEFRFQTIVRCEWCHLLFNDETPTQDHDHSCCSRKGFSCGKCLRGLVHRVCNLTAIAWFEWYEDRTGATLPMLRDYRDHFPRRK